MQTGSSADRSDSSPVDEIGIRYRAAGEQARLVAAGSVSPVELVDSALARIAEVNPELNCFCFVWEDEARAQANEAESAARRGAPLGLLHGVPIALKDTTPTAGHTTTLGSYTHADWVPDRDAAIVTALRAAGAIIVGKTTSPEFAYNLVTESPLWGVTRNPWNPARTTGGSSGGSGAAVASGCVALAEGSDMGGSVRIPAAWCGVVGLKPGLGRIPMDTLPGLFDQISHHGPLARTVDDARLFLAATQGPSDADILSVTTPLDLSAPVSADVRGLRVGLSLDLDCWDVADDVAKAVRHCANVLADAGAAVTEVHPRIGPDDEATWLRLWSVFMASYYGDLLETHRAKMDPNVVDLIEVGQAMSAVEHKRLEIARTDLWRRVAPVLADHDVLLCPTMAVGPLPASLEGHVPPAPVGQDGRLRTPDMTAVFNLIAPCPALSVPCGLDSDGLPIGAQIIGRRWREDVVLQVGAAVEAAFGLFHPPSVHPASVHPPSRSG